ncbi:hypothetical protein [Streptomyces sp. DH24]|uniref:hypothetical protein n=1 Tax=Streptomyces sp. DH24 TaxID=3040123 RepID=UPI002442B934|nr:hypothetical protein [Streptomyces sp. DH24]MDG9715932.1 hypothetical protein [Streptomyces sp. DH24]
MPGSRPETRLVPHAGLPRAHRRPHVLHSTVDAHGRAHWLLSERAPDRAREGPVDALVVTVEDGSPYETRLSAVLPQCTRVEALPDGGFVLYASRTGGGEPQVQVFDALGRPTWTFRVGDAVQHLLADEAGDLWVGHFDEGIYGDDLSGPGLRRWSSTGEPLWAHAPGSKREFIDDCYALNVTGRTAWTCPYRDFPLIGVQRDGTVRVWENPVRGASGLAVRGPRVAFFGGHGDDHDRLVVADLGGDAVTPVAQGRLVRPDGGTIGGRRVVGRGFRLYVQEKPWAEWAVFDLGDAPG